MLVMVAIAKAWLSSRQLADLFLASCFNKVKNLFQGHVLVHFTKEIKLDVGIAYATA